MKRKLLSIAVACFMLASCYTHVHTVGSGGSGGEKVEKRAWYILWGIVPLNQFDTKELAGNATNYTVKTSMTPLDFVINIFTGIITVGSRTVEVQK